LADALDRERAQEAAAAAAHRRSPEGRHEQTITLLREIRDELRGRSGR
jgi:hypothetical protein